MCGAAFLLAEVMEREGRRAMSKGNELWAKRDDLLKDLYERGAISPERAVKAGEVREAIGVDETDFRALFRSLKDEDFVAGRPVEEAKVWLSGTGFREARGLVEVGRRPMV